MREPYDWIVSNLVEGGMAALQAAVMAQFVIIVAILALSYLVNLVARQLILAWVKKLIVRTETLWDDILAEKHLFDRFSHLAPALVIYVLAGLAFPDADEATGAIRRVAIAYMIVVTAVVIDALLNGVVEIYRTTEISRSRPIKSYIQVVKLVVYLVTAILVLSTLLDRSPWAFLSGVGALTAVIMLVFKDTILGFVASIQLVSHDMIRRGDWIEMPGYGADGDVIDITLNTVKVQNWDKTISTIPTYALVSETFKNWRGMDESGGRRIKRSVAIDMHSIRFCDEEMLDRFGRVRLLQEYIAEKRAELAEHNEEFGIESDVRINTRNLTNVGTFRAYLVAYLRSHPRIHKGMTFLVRQLPPGEHGLPIEIYVFSNDQDWVNYENIVADIFDHMLSVIPEFGLDVYQAPSGGDVKAVLEGITGSR